MKRFEHSPLGKESQTQTEIDIAKKQYPILDNNFWFDKIIKKEKLALENYSKSDLIYNSHYSFYKYHSDSKKFDNLSLKSRYSFLAGFLNALNKFNQLKTQRENTKKKKNKFV